MPCGREGGGSATGVGVSVPLGGRRIRKGVKIHALRLSFRRVKFPRHAILARARVWRTHGYQTPVRSQGKHRTYLGTVGGARNLADAGRCGGQNDPRGTPQSQLRAT